MHVAILSFQLVDITPEQFKAQCDDLAPSLAQTPGLISKVWLGDATSNTYGGVYSWRDRASFQAFAQGGIAKGLMTNPHLKNVIIRDFVVLEGPTRVTRGLPETAVQP